MLDRLDESIREVCPIHGLSKTGNVVTIDYKAEATNEQIIAAQAVLVAFDWSQAAHDAWLQQKDRQAAIAWMESGEMAARCLRASMLLVRNEFRSVKAGQPMPNRTWAQLKEAMADMIAAGMSDPGYDPDEAP